MGVVLGAFYGALQGMKQQRVLAWVGGATTCSAGPWVGIARRSGSVLLVSCLCLVQGMVWCWSRVGGTARCAIEAKQSR